MTLLFVCMNEAIERIGGNRKSDGGGLKILFEIKIKNQKDSFGQNRVKLPFLHLGNAKMCTSTL